MTEVLPPAVSAFEQVRAAAPGAQSLARYIAAVRATRPLLRVPCEEGPGMACKGHGAS